MRAGLQVNWRDKASYAYATKLSGLGWAWEFLRRNPRFREDFAKTAVPARTKPQPAGSTLRRWGLLRADSPDRNGAVADIFWDPAVCSHVLPLIAAATAPGAPRHVLIREGARRLQLVIQYTPWLAQDELLTQALIPRDALRRRQRLLASLNAYIFTGHLLEHPFENVPGAMRLTNVAQALDGALSNAAHREIAAAVYGERRVLTTWNDPGDHLRDAVRRSINRGRNLINGGYWRFLR